MVSSGRAQRGLLAAAGGESAAGAPGDPPGEPAAARATGDRPAGDPPPERGARAGRAGRGRHSGQCLNQEMLFVLSSILHTWKEDGKWLNVKFKKND